MDLPDRKECNEYYSGYRPRPEGLGADLGPLRVRTGVAGAQRRNRGPLSPEAVPRAAGRWQTTTLRENPASVRTEPMTQGSQNE